MLEDNIWLSVLWMLVCIVLILGAAYWFTRYAARRGLLGAFGAAAGEQMEVLAQLSLGKDQRLVVVQTGDRYFLLGVAAGGISALAELSEEEAARWKRLEDQQPPSFREAFQTALKKKGWR